MFSMSLEEKSEERENPGSRDMKPIEIHVDPDGIDRDANLGLVQAPPTLAVQNGSGTRNQIKGG